jgi:acyl-CoA reductase-like NAD-dependent aldehyde dehydrogenase
MDVPSLVGGRDAPPASGGWFDKLQPADGALLCRVARSTAADVGAAIAAARDAQPGWAAVTPVERGRLVREVALALDERREEAAELVVAETGKARDLALGEVDAAVEMGHFAAGEGRRLHGRTTTSSMPNRTVLAVRSPVGVAPPRRRSSAGCATRSSRPVS